jgi:glycosyltransferase involved in cell wall biosynthesis
VVILGIDASRVDAAVQTGTERYARAVIDALVRLQPASALRLYGRQPVNPWPHVPWVTVRPNRLWTHLGLSRELAIRPPGALFIPAHVLPVRFASAAARARTHTVVTVHDLGYRHFPLAHPWRQRLYLDMSTRFTARFADVLIADSQATARDLQTEYQVPADKITVAYPGPLPLAKPGAETLGRYGLTPGGYVLHIGTQQPRKNLRRLIEAWARAGLADLTLVLAGAPGWGGEDLDAEIAWYGIRDRVRRIGYVDDADKSALLHAARIYVFPSLYEGFGFPVLEAHEAGIPLVCSNTSSLPEVAGDAAVFFDPTQPGQIAEALRQAAQDDTLRRSLIERGHVNRRRFDWVRCARTILDTLSA